MSTESDDDIIYFYSPHSENGWLANFSRHEIRVAGTLWPTVEHYFQAMKFEDPGVGDAIRRVELPDEAKQLAKRNCERKRSDWSRVRCLVMYNAIRAKFRQHPELASALRDTVGRQLVEDAPDAYWGGGADRRGRNQMGRLLMRLRSEKIGRGT